MNLQLFTAYSVWFLPLCVLAGVLYAGVLYFRERRIRDAVPAPWLRWLMAVLRAVVVSVLAAFLLSPYLKSRFHETQKPIVVIAQDNSSSILQDLPDTAAYNSSLRDLRKTLEKTYDVRDYTFGDKLQEGLVLNYNERSTGISDALNGINNLYKHLNVGAVILASDGIYNTGSNPAYVKDETGAPIYSIALGDTIPKKDIRIARVLCNKIVYLGDRFTIGSDIEADFCKGETTPIALSEIVKGDTHSIATQKLSIDADTWSQSLTWTVTPDAPGIRHYRLRIPPLDNEVTTDNNVEDIYVEVLDARQKILLLANAPHPDIAAIRRAIESNRNYQVDVRMASGFRGSAAGYDLVILHDLPSLENPVSNVISTAREKNTPLFFILGDETSRNALNNVQTLVDLSGGGKASNEITAATDPDFNLFTLDQKSLATFPKLPALLSPYGTYTTSPASQVLLYQKIGQVTTKYPLLLYSLPGAQKTAVLCAENIWKWCLYDYVLNKNQDATNELIGKTIQYLAAKTDKKQFRAYTAKNIFNENEPVLLSAELYNDSYELVNAPDVSVTITDEAGKDYNFQFSRQGNAYDLNAGFFPSGSYRFTAQVSYNGKKLSDNGAFSIAPVHLEALHTTADHKLLNRIAVQSGGTMIYPQQIDQLPALIAQNAAAKPVLREVTRTESLIDLKWIFFTLLTLLAAEWFIRKFMGGY